MGESLRRAVMHISEENVPYYESKVAWQVNSDMDEKHHSLHYDVVIIGAGLYGIQAARYYLDIYPEIRLCIIESDEVAGGTWSLKRNYNAFWTQTPVGMAEFSDRPMKPPPEEDQYYGFFPARYVSEYFESYLDNHTYNGSSLRDRILFNTRIKSIEKSADGLWNISSHSNTTFRTPKLIDATGMTSLPNMPRFPGQETFQGILLHHKDFGQSTFLSDPRMENIVVLGGAKSAADVAYASAKAGKTVSWIIREDGNGPAAFLDGRGKGPYKNSNESFYTRLVASLLPNPFGRRTFLSRCLHETKIGSWLVGKIWDRVDNENRRKVDYHRFEGQEHGFKNLEPDTPVFWQNDSSGINQRPDFYSVIASKVYVYRQSIASISAKSVNLAANRHKSIEEQAVSADVLICCTGWSAISPLYSVELALDLGLPASQREQKPTDVAGWQARAIVADEKVQRRFPILRYPPIYRKVKPPHTPFRLYKAMIPLSDVADRSIVFLGKMVVGNNFRVAEVQALWAVAYLTGKLNLDSIDMIEDVAETVAWCQRRYLNKGELGAWFYFDVVNFTDMLLAQLGLSSHRQKGSLRNWFSPCIAIDLRGLVEEYKKRCPSHSKGHS